MSPAMLSWPSAPSTASATGASAGPEPSASPSSDVSDVRIMSSTSGRNRPTICSIPGMEHTPPTKSLSTPPRVTTGAVPTRFTSRKWGSVASGWSVYRPSIVMVSASTTMSQSTGAPNTWAVTSTGTCRPDSVTTARTSPWFESRATEKSSMVAGPPVAARACTTHRITRVTHSSRNTVPGGATARGIEAREALDHRAELGEGPLVDPQAHRVGERRPLGEDLGVVAVAVDDRPALPQDVADE